MSALLFIGPNEREKIQAAVEKARSKPIPWDHLKAYVLSSDRRQIKLGDRPPGFERVESQHVLIPLGYRASISFEEQPAGIMRHLSISVEKDGMMPSKQAIVMIAQEFGFTLGEGQEGQTWVEEFRPGHYAFNLIQVAVKKTGPETRQ